MDWREARKRMIPVAVSALLGVALVEGGRWSGERTHIATPRILEGRASELSDHNTIACCSDRNDTRSAGGQVFLVDRVAWRDKGAGETKWREGVPGCLSRTSPNVIRMGAGTIRKSGDAPGNEFAVWLECL
jgi:hypothetical protein